MKTTRPFPQTWRAIALVACLALPSIAQPPPGGPRGPGGPPPPGGGGNQEQPPPPAGDLSPLGPMVDKFQAFQRAQLHGEKFYTKEEENLQRNHADAYRLISENLISDKIAEDKGNSLIAALIEIGKKHKDAAAASTDVNTETALLELVKQIKAAGKDQVKEEELTPEINRVEHLMNELIRFSSTDTKLSSKSSSLKRRLDDLIAAEARAKSDGDVNDREREKLTRLSSETWQEFLKILKR